MAFDTRATPSVPRSAQLAHMMKSSQRTCSENVQTGRVIGRQGSGKARRTSPITWDAAKRRARNVPSGLPPSRTALHIAGPRKLHLLLPAFSDLHARRRSRRLLAPAMMTATPSRSRRASDARVAREAGHRTLVIMKRRSDESTAPVRRREMLISPRLPNRRRSGFEPVGRVFESPRARFFGLSSITCARPVRGGFGARRLVLAVVPSGYGADPVFRRRGGR